MVRIIIFVVVLAAATVTLVYVAGKITDSLFEPSEKRIAQKKESPAEKPTSEKQLERGQPDRKSVTGQSGKSEEPGGVSASNPEQEFPPVDPNSPAAPYWEAFKLMVEPTKEQDDLMWKVEKEGWNEEYPELVKLLEANSEALLRLKAAIEMGSCYFPLLEDADFNIRFPQLYYIRQAAKILALEARFLEKEGDVECAARNIADGMKFSQDVARKGTVVSDLLGLSIESIFIGMVSKEVCKDSVNLDLCKALESTFYEPERTQERIEEALDAEQAFIEREISKLPSKSKDEIKALRPFHDADYSVADSCIDSKTVEKVTNLYDEYYRELRGALQEGIVPALKKGAELEEQMQEHARSKELPELLFTYLALSLKRYVEQKARVAADYEMARTGLGLELYAAENGKYPESLSELVPKYLSCVPVDPFSGEVLKYAKGEKGWTIHSFGPDMDDDNGEKERHMGSDDDDYDIILRKK
jgi:hypothetical protein